MGKAERRDVDTDFMRVICAFLVVMIHTSSLKFRAGVVYQAAASLSVPVFVIISGYYLLSGRRPLWRKSGALLLTMVVWSALYFLFDCAAGTPPADTAAGVVRYLLTQPVHLWYLYAIVFLYLLTPLLSVFARNATRGQYRYALAVAFILGSPVILLLRSGLSPTLAEMVSRAKAPYTQGFVFLYLLGGYIRRFGIAKRAAIYAAGGVGLLATVAGGLWLPEYNGLFFSFFAPGVIAESAAFFVLVQRVCKRWPLRSGRGCAVLSEAAGCTMGIYLLHPMALRVLNWGIGGFLLRLPPVVEIPVWTALGFLLSFICVFLWRRMRGVFRRAGERAG